MGTLVMTAATAPTVTTSSGV